MPAPTRRSRCPSGATLAGTASDDGLPAGSSLTTTWSKFSGPGTVDVRQRQPAEHDATLLRRRARTSCGSPAATARCPATDDVTIVVNPAGANPPPVVNAGADQTITLPGQAA